MWLPNASSVTPLVASRASTIDTSIGRKADALARLAMLIDQIINPPDQTNVETLRR